MSLEEAIGNRAVDDRKPKPENVRREQELRTR
jgi:hypothetical protein